MRIPLFPLHAVLSPGIALPLHVFEDRYRALVRFCLDTKSPFGVVLIREGSEVARGPEPQKLAIAAVGTLAEIREASRYSDGRWDLVAVGGRRFIVRDVHNAEAPYLVADVDPLEDEPGDRDAAEALVGRVTRRFVDYLRLLRPRDGEAGEPIDVRVEVDAPGDDGGAQEGGTGLRIPDDPSTLSFLLAGIVQVEPDRRQALLEAPTAEARLRAIDALLDRELLLLSMRLAPYVPERTAAVVN